jgi:hypothetical protein
LVHARGLEEGSIVRIYTTQCLNTRQSWYITLRTVCAPPLTAGPKHEMELHRRLVEVEAGPCCMGCIDTAVLYAVGDTCNLTHRCGALHQSVLGTRVGATYCATQRKRVHAKEVGKGSTLHWSTTCSRVVCLIATRSSFKDTIYGMVHHTHIRQPDQLQLREWLVPSVST